jgi:O-antigen ligase
LSHQYPFSSPRLAAGPSGWLGTALRAAIIVLSVGILGPAIMGLTTVQIVALAAGTLALPLFARRPEIALSAMLLIIASIFFEEVLPLLPVPGGSFHVTDVLLLFFLFLIPFKLLFDPSFNVRGTSGDLPLFLFLAAAIVSAGNAILAQGVDFNVVMRLLRGLMYYALYFVVTNFIRERRQVRFLARAMFGIAAFVSVAMILQAIVGESVRLMPGRIEAAQAFNESFEATRILPPGDILVFVMFITALTLFALGSGRKSGFGGSLLPVLLGAGVLLTYNRNYWASIIISLLVLAGLASKTGKRRVLAWTATVAVILVILIPSLAGTGGRIGAYYESLRSRFVSLVSPAETYGSRSLEWRRIEIDFALQSAARNPVLGIGLGQDYRPRIDWMDYYRQGRIWSHMSYMHNGYLYILVDMGLIGLLPFLWLLLRFLAKGFASWKKRGDLPERGLVLGFTLGGLAIMLSAIMSPRFLEWPGIVVLAVLMGLTESISRLEKQEAPAPAEGARP